MSCLCVLCDVLCAGSLQKQGVDERAGSRGSAKEEAVGQDSHGLQTNDEFRITPQNYRARARERERE